METQIVEAALRIGSSRHLLLILRQFFVQEVWLLSANLDAQNLNMEEKDMPNFKGWNKIRAVLMLISVSGKGGLLSWLFLLWAGPLQSRSTALLGYKRPNITHWLSQSPLEHSNLTISHFTSLHFTWMYLYITTQAQFSLLSGFLFLLWRLHYTVALALPLKSQLALLLLSFGKHPLKTVIALLITYICLFSSVLALSSSLS